MGDTLRPLVRSGREGVIFNGVPDWLYGEKILKTNKVLWWAPDGSQISFVSFDDSKVEAVSYPKYGTYDDPNNVVSGACNVPQLNLTLSVVLHHSQQYPELVTLRYPKAGRENPVASVWVSDLRLGSSQPKRLMPPNEVLGRDHYFTSLSWIDQDRVAVVWMRREQNYSVVSLCFAEKNWACEKVSTSFESSRLSRLYQLALTRVNCAALGRETRVGVERMGRFAGRSVDHV